MSTAIINSKAKQHIFEELTETSPEHYYKRMEHHDTAKCVRTTTAVTARVQAETEEVDVEVVEHREEPKSAVSNATKMSLKDKVSCSVRVPASSRLTKIIVQAELTKSWLCFTKRKVCPILTIYLDNARPDNLPDGTHAYPVCRMHVHSNKIQQLQPNCFAKIKVKRGNKTVTKNAIDAQHLIQCMKEHRNFAKIHVNLVVSSFQPLTCELKLQTTPLHQLNEESRNAVALEDKLFCSVRVPSTMTATEITLEAQVIKSRLCYVQKFKYPILTMSLDPASRDKLADGTYCYPACCVDVNLNTIHALDPDSCVKMKVKRGLGTVSKKAVDARQIIHSFKHHSKFRKININLSVSSFHPLSFEIKVDTEAVHQVNMESITARNVKNEPSCSVRVPTTSVNGIVLQAQERTPLPHKKNNNNNAQWRQKIPVSSPAKLKPCIKIDKYEKYEVRIIIHSVHATPTFGELFPDVYVRARMANTGSDWCRTDAHNNCVGGVALFEYRLVLPRFPFRERQGVSEPLLSLAVMNDDVLTVEDDKIGSITLNLRDLPAPDELESCSLASLNNETVNLFEPSSIALIRSKSAVFQRELTGCWPVTKKETSRSQRRATCSVLMTIQVLSEMEAAVNPVDSGNKDVPANRFPRLITPKRQHAIILDQHLYQQVLTVEAVIEYVSGIKSIALFSMVVFFIGAFTYTVTLEHLWQFGAAVYGHGRHNIAVSLGIVFSCGVVLMFSYWDVIKDFLGMNTVQRTTLKYTEAKSKDTNGKKGKKRGRFETRKRKKC